MNRSKGIFLVIFFLFTRLLFGQSFVSGAVFDEATKPLVNANITVKSISKTFFTDAEGRFKLNTTIPDDTIIVSLVGYKTKSIWINSNFNTMAIVLKENRSKNKNTDLVDIALSEQLKYQNVVDALKVFPSVYTTKSGGSFGDGRLSIRGFNQKNIAVLLDGIPLNDMKNGGLSWSRWTGLSNSANTIEFQSGFGNSNLSVPSIGGTVNILTKSIDSIDKGTILFDYGINNYTKFLVKYVTGKTKNGLSTSFLLGRTFDDGYVAGTKFEGYNYYMNFAYDFNKFQGLEIMLAGSPQIYDVRYLGTRAYNMASLGDYLKYGKTYNCNTGTLRGETFNWRKRFNYSPLFSVKWNYKINDLTSLSTTLYTSFTRGGITGDIGNINKKDNQGNIILKNNKPQLIYASDILFRDKNGLVAWDKIKSYNSGEEVRFGNGIYKRTADEIANGVNLLARRVSINTSNNTGCLVTLNSQLSEKLRSSFGLDLRRYKSIYYRSLNNLLGASGVGVVKDINNKGEIYNTTQAINFSSLLNVFNNGDKDNKVGYHNEAKIGWYSAFSNLSYTNEDIKSFLKLSFSQQTVLKVNHFNYLATDSNSRSVLVTDYGGVFKGGVDFTLNTSSLVYARAGYMSKQPLFDAVFFDSKSNNVNSYKRNEEIQTFEVGHKYQSTKFDVTTNLYATNWLNRYESISFKSGIIDLVGVSQINSGFELLSAYRLSDKTRLKAMFSYGNWRYSDNVIGKVYNDKSQYVSDFELYLKGVKVGNVAQTTAFLGLETKLYKNLILDYRHHFNYDLYANIKVKDFRKSKHQGALKLPGYAIGNLGVSYKFVFDKLKSPSLDIRLNLNNFMDTEYIAESATNYFPNSAKETYLGISKSNRVFFGFGRTWNLSLRYNF